VPARNEERAIADCLESLVQQRYPSDRYEIIVVNDRSTDNTPSIIKNYMEKYKTIKCVSIDSNPSELTGKQNALNEGLKLCAGEIILNTDADCIVGPLWVRRTVSYFTPQVGLTIGFSTTYRSFKSSKSLKSNRVPEHSPTESWNDFNGFNGFNDFFADLQSLDMLFLMDAAAGAIGMNVPVSCLGRNMAYRKAVLDDIGYSGMGYTVTEDAALIQAVAKKTNWDIAVVYDKAASVSTLAEESVKQFLSQRTRWALGGRATRSWSQIPLYATFLFHLCLAISFPLMFFARSLIAVTLFSVSVKVILDFVRCWRVCKEFDRTGLLMLFVPYEIFMTCYSILTGFGSIFIRKVRWKGEEYTRGKNYTQLSGSIGK
jgi:cellulose synthase/poly-beta-1,6-N-acetylglucosamine synthase-like glycosyltransferase